MTRTNAHYENLLISSFMTPTDAPLMYTHTHTHTHTHTNIVLILVINQLDAQNLVL
jgi:hypothetical protein